MSGLDMMRDVWWLIATGAAICGFIAGWAVKLDRMTQRLESLERRLTRHAEKTIDAESELETTIGIIIRGLFCLLDREVEDKGANGNVRRTRDELRDHLATI